MIVVCKHKTGHILPKDLFPLGGWNSEMCFPRLTVGALYIVYGISIIKNHEWFLICEDGFDENTSNYPSYLPAALFEVASSTFSKYWEERIQLDEYTGEKVANRGFPRLLDDTFFLGNLLDDSKREIQLFLDYKNLVDKEIHNLLEKI